MSQKLFAVTAATSAALCLAAVALGLRSYTATDRFSGLRGGDRYTLVSAGGRLTLVGPPPPAADPAVGRTVGELAAALGNDQILLHAWLAPEGSTEMTVRRVAWSPRFKSPADRCDRQFNDADTVRPLLAALEDPRRFAA